IEALTSANKLIFDNAQGIVDRQMEMFRDAMDQAVSSVKSASKAKSSKDVVNQQTKLMQLGVEKSLTSMRDITESITKANAQAFDIANKRMTENMSEFKQFVQKLKG
ncbi:MAG: phasin family protein, partial [Gammaproteobacteria bacterium]|nr:phasin family protein [Gammaproteobacteria bacterium]